MIFMIKAGIIGATGYAGLEIARLLLGHPQAEIAAVSSVSFAGKALSEVYPSMLGLLDMELEDEDAVIERSDVVFACLPHGLSEKLAARCVTQGKIFIDMGADFRLSDEADYSAWYGGGYADKKLHESAVYGLPELFREKIKTARLIANPGCYPTSVALGLAPLLKNRIIDTNSIIIDAKSGVTGAGREPSQNTHYPECNEAFAPYKIAEHRHTPEIEQALGLVGGEKACVTFVPHLLPVNRGILSTIYSVPTKQISKNDIHGLYREFYKGERFVRVLPVGGIANLRNVKYSNYCDISLHTDERTGRIIIASAIDNMVKGASGQAVQNMNLACGLPEESGLLAVPPAF